MKQFLIGMLALSFLSPVGAVAQSQNPGEHFMENWDLDGNHAVDLKEIQTRRADVFSAFDSDEDGYLSAREYAVFDEARANDMAQIEGAGRGMHRPAEGMRLEANDTDGDGRVSLEEFQENASGWLEAIDRNKDRVITTADFGRGK